MINRYTTRAQCSRYTRSLALPIHPSIHPVRVQRSRRPSSALHAARAYMQRRKEKAESSWETHGLYDRTMKFVSLLDFFVR